MQSASCQLFAHLNHQRTVAHSGWIMDSCQRCVHFFPYFVPEPDPDADSEFPADHPMMSDLAMHL